MSTKIGWNMYICQLPSEMQATIRAALEAVLDDAEDVERGMDSRICDLTDTIDVYAIVEPPLKGMLISLGELPKEVDIERGEEGCDLYRLEALVGGRVEPFDVVLGEEITLYVDDEGLFLRPPNRAIYATKSMEEAGYLSQVDFAHPVKENELYTVLHGDIVALGFNPETGETRSLTPDEAKRVKDYFTDVSEPGSGVYAEMAIKAGMTRPTRERVGSFTRGVKFYESSPDASEHTDKPNSLEALGAEAEESSLASNSRESSNLSRVTER